MSIDGKRTVDDIHKELGQIMWNNVGITRNEEGLTKAVEKIPELKEEFWKNAKVTGSSDDFNQTLERAGRVADFLNWEN